MRICIERTWDGSPALPGERTWLELSVDGDALHIAVDAPHHGDPLPAAAPGSCDGLWEFEVVELFLLGRDERYLELEVGPAGHWLALELQGRRRRVRSDVDVSVRCAQRGDRWRAELELPRRELPTDLQAWNAYAIHGRGNERRYLAFQPVPGARPDFHRLEHFAPLPASLRDALLTPPGS